METLNNILSSYFDQRLKLSLELLQIQLETVHKSLFPTIKHLAEIAKASPDQTVKFNINPEKPEYDTIVYQVEDDKEYLYINTTVPVKIASPKNNSFDWMDVKPRFQIHKDTVSPQILVNNNYQQIVSDNNNILYNAILELLLMYNKEITEIINNNTISQRYSAKSRYTNN